MESSGSSFSKWLNLTAILATIISTVIALYLVLGINKDPREELTLKGITWDYQNFISALSEKDEDVVALFSEAGMKLRKEDFSHFLYHYLTPKIGLILLDNTSISDVICPTDYNSLFLYTELRNEPVKYDYLKKLCNTLSVKNGVLDTLANETKKQAQVKSYNSSRQSNINTCLSELQRVPVNDFYMEIAENYNLTEVTKNTPRQYVISEVGFGLLTSSKEINRNPAKFLYDKIALACESHYPKKKFSKNRISHVKDALNIFNI